MPSGLWPLIRRRSRSKKCVRQEWSSAPWIACWAPMRPDARILADRNRTRRGCAKAGEVVDGCTRDQRSGSGERVKKFGVYIHMPFCSAKCNYCTFVIKPLREEVARGYQRAVVRELEDFFSHKGDWEVADSIYFGGGTPSLVPAEHIADILSACRRLFEFSSDCEISLEANPGTLTRGKLELYRESGVNRVSLGAQTFDDRGLAAIGRNHTSEETAASLGLLRNHGFENLNLDLILGLPGQDEAGWTTNLERVGELAPTHVSVYMLEMDEASPLYHLVARGRRHVPDEDS